MRKFEAWLKNNMIGLTHKMANETSALTDGIKYQTKADRSLEDDEISQDPRAQDIAIPLLIFVLICIIVLVFKLKYGRRKIGTIESKNEGTIMEPGNNPLEIRFKSLIGRGSFGVVWKASLKDAIVAVKMCSVDQKDRWEKEKEVLKDIGNHPNVVKMIDYEVRKLRDEIALTIVLEFVDNGSLRTHLMENRLNIEKTLVFLKSFYDGLRFLHSQKDKTNKRKKCVAHRDIKSSNILVSSLKGCVIADFGLALTFNEGDSLSNANAKVGTSRYMAPEKLVGIGDDAITGQALCLIDIYAASLVTYEIMTRCCFEFDSTKNGCYEAAEYKLPFGDHIGSQPSNDDMKRLVVYEDIRPIIPEEWNNHTVTKKIKNLILRCWDKNPKRRKSAEQIDKEIKGIFLNHELEQNFNDFDDMVKYSEEDKLLLHNMIEIEINENIE